MSETQVQGERATRTIEGRVISTRMNKTLTVLIERQEQHGLFGKIMRRSTKLHVHDEAGEAREGDVVRVVECRPLSKTKHHKLVAVVTRAGD